VDSFKPCPYCGVLYSGKHGIEKRNEVRIKTEIPFFFISSSDFLNASTVNLSKNGFSVRIFGRHFLSVGNILDLTLRDSKVTAQVKWVNDKSEQSVTTAGFKIVDGKINRPAFY
jgi:hypothetical protein